MISLQSAGKIRIERTIYDPVTNQFLLSSYRPLANVKEWINRADRSAYWYIVCIHNESSYPIDEWGIELETSPGISIVNSRIEGIDQPIPLGQSQSKPWLIKWTLGISHESGIVIPRSGSRRIFFKLGSNSCGVKYKINGKFISPDITIPFREKTYVHSCDVPTLKTAMVNNPEQALKYTQTILLQSYEQETALKILNSFRILTDINRYCELNQHERIIEKLHLLEQSLEGIAVSEGLNKYIEENANAMRILGPGPESIKRAKDICDSLPDKWIQVFLQRSGSYRPSGEEIKVTYVPPVVIEPEKSGSQPTEGKELSLRSKIIVVVFGFLVLVVILSSFIAPFVFSPNLSSGKIAFSSYRDGNWEIYIMNPDGTGQVDLTNSPANEYSPVWSPGGSKIAFASDWGGQGDIYTINADGSGKVDLTNNPATDYMAAWSPDGTKIAFVSNRDGNYEIYLMNADGSGQTRLTTNPADDYNPTWSPDGSKIVFDSYRSGNSDIYIMNADRPGQTLLATNPAKDSKPAWSPDGSKIVFVSERDGNNEIYLMNADGTGEIDLSNNRAVDWEPAWSPDGSKIVFVSNRDGNFEIYVMNPDGSGQTRLTTNPATDDFPSWTATVTMPSSVPSPSTPPSTPTMTPSVKISDFHFTEVIYNDLPNYVSGFAEASCTGQFSYETIKPAGWKIVFCEDVPMGSHGGSPTSSMCSVRLEPA